MECEEFWCRNTDCKSYSTGESCSACEKNNKCCECILNDNTQNQSPNIQDCIERREQIFDAVAYERFDELEEL